MDANKVIDVPAESEPSQALTVRDAVQAVERASVPEKPTMTAAQAKIEAVANLTAAAYSKASELRLTPEESAALLAPFEDSDFQPGAAGKEKLIYIQHSALRDRFTKVLGLGQWALIARSRWAQEDNDSTTVYVEAMLMIRGCFVSEAIGDMVYWPRNKATNYGDAVEGATTQAFRRCAKHFGVGLQAWDKAWCEGWWQRRNGQSKAPSAPTQRIEHPRNQAPSKPAQAPQQTRASAPEGEGVFPVCSILSVTAHPGKSKTTGKPYTKYNIAFHDGFADLAAETFDKGIADLANTIANDSAKARIQTKPGFRQGTMDIVTLNRALDDAKPRAAADTDELPMEFDEQGNPVDGVTP